ncbi:MAG: glycosyltransferase [Muribaculaceae bacterium]|nr:glycosyltransferase [Muribaculaceae bacterium]
MKKQTQKPEKKPAKKPEQIGLLTETSWEVCNKIGGIYTVLSTKAKVLQLKYGDSLVFIGPDIWSDDNKSPFFKESKSLLNNFASREIPEFDIKVRCGRWDIPGSPQVILVKFDGVYPSLDTIFGEMWHQFGVDSLHEYGDYREGCAFSVASAIVTQHLALHLGVAPKRVFAHFNEWTTGMGLLYLRSKMPEAATLFTTHATSIGRSICGNGKPLYDYFDGYDGNQMARELNMEAKHSLESTAARQADCFTAVSDLTAKEAEKLLETAPQVVTPNGFEPGFVPGQKKYKALRKEGREKLLRIASKLKGRNFSDDTLIIATSGRNEYRNKGLDLFLDTMAKLEESCVKKDILGLVLTPAWVADPDPALKDCVGTPANNYMTHSLHNEGQDSVALRIRTLQAEGKIGNKVNVVFVPCYLDGKDGIVDISYYDLLPAIDVTVFPSYYEPWGYTPLESIAFGIPTITTDKSGFGQWAVLNHRDSILEAGVKVASRTDSNYGAAAQEISETLCRVAGLTEKERKESAKAAYKTAEMADWKYFIEFYYEAFAIAAKRRNIRLKAAKK